MIKRANLKSLIVLILIIAMLMITAACSAGGGGGGASQTNLTGTAEEVLQQILDGIVEKGIVTPMALPPLTPSPESSQNDIGLSDADFNRLVETASSSVAAIGTFAHQIVIIQAKSAAMAVEVKTLISGAGGYDAQKWVCVFPDVGVAVDSGSYVLLAASTNEIVDAAVNVFEAAAGTTGTVVTFWDFANENIDPNVDFGGGGMDLITVP